MKRKGMNKIYYKIWKHLGKKINKDQASLYPPPVNLEREILNEIVALRKYLILKDVCPEIINAISPKISIPNNEIGNETFLKYFRYIDTFKTPSPYDFLWYWLPDVAVDVNNTLISYQAAQFPAEEYRKNVNSYANDDIPASIKNNIKYMFSILCYGEPFDDGEEFFTKVINSKNLDNYSPFAYMLLCNFFLYKKRFEEAQKSLDMYIKKQGRDGLDEWLPVADFAYKNGMKEFSMQSAVFNEIMKTTEEGLFAQKIKDKTVALIGNGPQERGQNKKDIIDSHEIVIRMNNYDLQPDYAKDYGEKCDIWYQFIGLTDQEWKKEKGHPSLYFIGNSPFSTGYPRELIKRYANELSKGIKIQAVTLSDLFDLNKMTKIYSISGGLLMIYLTKKANPKFSVNDCFGFSFKEDKEKLSWSHMEGEVFMPGHSLDMERPVIRNILSKEKI